MSGVQRRRVQFSMRLLLIVLATLPCGIYCLTTHLNGRPKIDVLNPTWEAGTVPVGRPLEGEFTIRNTNNDPVDIETGRFSSCIRAHFVNSGRRTVPARGNAKVKVVFYPEGALGESVDCRGAIYTADENNSVLALRIRWRISEADVTANQPVLIAGLPVKDIDQANGRHAEVHVEFERLSRARSHQSMTRGQWRKRFLQMRLASLLYRVHAVTSRISQVSGRVFNDALWTGAVASLEVNHR